jgi:hypothetical protein
MAAARTRVTRVATVLLIAAVAARCGVFVADLTAGGGAAAAAAAAARSSGKLLNDVNGAHLTTDLDHDENDYGADGDGDALVAHKSTKSARMRMQLRGLWGNDRAAVDVTRTLDLPDFLKQGNKFPIVQCFIGPKGHDVHPMEDYQGDWVRDNPSVTSRFFDATKAKAGSDDASPLFIFTH